MSETSNILQNATPEIAESAVKKIGIEQLRTAQSILEKYKDGKANLDNKIIANEDWWKMNHFRNYKDIKHVKDDQGKVYALNDYVMDKRQSAWIFNSIMNKHADAMDNYPEPSVLPRARDDEKAAKDLSSILPVVLDNCKFEQTYSDNWWDKLLNGCAIYSVSWNNDLLNGLGDVDITPVDLLSFYYEPGIQDIQDSANVFVTALVDNDVLESQYPELKGKIKSNPNDVKKYNYDDSVDTTNKSLVVDWYYKVNENGTNVLHYVKWVNDEILYSTENEGTSLYNHGKYPFVMDVLFREKGTPCGFGYIDVMRSAQEEIDEMGADIRMNAKWGTKPRYFSKDENAINQEEFQDVDHHQIVHVAGSIDDQHVKIIDTKPLDGNYLTYYTAKIDELKETSGNRDFSQGSTASGVTSGSAIAALQEAGSKGSRDMIKGAYRAFTEICELVIELIRQFYTEPRTFRILGETGEADFAMMDNSQLISQPYMVSGVEFFTKEPVFDIKVKAQKSSPYSRLSQNELALQFYQLGFFNPQISDQALATIDMMDFEGKDKVTAKIKDNGTMFAQLQAMQGQMIQLADALAQATGDTRVRDALMAQQMGQPLPQGGSSDIASTDAMGQPIAANTTAADKARANTQNMSGVK